MATDAQASTVTTPYLVVLSVLTGDLFRVDPDGFTALLSEDDLRYPESIAEAIGSYDSEFFRSERQGDAFTLVAFSPCYECGGSGTHTCGAWFAPDQDGGPEPELVGCEWDWGPARRVRGMFFVPESAHICCRCNGEQQDYEFTEEIVTHAELAQRLEAIREAA